MRRIEHLDPQRIVVDEGRRPLDPDAVATLRESIERIGLVNPITVWRPNMNSPHLVAGRHRLEAVRQLKHESIPCFVLEETAANGADVAVMAEISENLHRKELSEIERAELVAKWAEISARPAPGVLRQVDAKPPTGGRPRGGVRQVARDLGLSEPDVRRSVKIAALSPEAKAVARETGADRVQAVLLEAAKEPDPAAQVAVIQKRAKPAKAKPSARPAEYVAIARTWAGASPEVRAEIFAAFPSTIDQNFPD
jgi:ParB-like chromosome segregation protein Spo0J